MRALNLRAWDEERAYMTYSSTDCWSFDEFGGMWAVAKRIGYYDSNTHTSHEVKGMEVMQGTGRHDKNGKEIFQGDIFGGIAALRCVVQRLDDGSYWLVFCDARAGSWSITDPRVCESEIVGNRFENPDMLKENTDG